jgi:hypothetical protein
VIVGEAEGAVLGVVAIEIALLSIFLEGEVERNALNNINGYLILVVGALSFEKSTICGVLE